MNSDFYAAIENRRSIYGIGKDPAVADEKILERIRQAVKYTPTSFNAQTGRAVLLLNEHHHKLWDLTKETLRKIVAPENFGPTEEKIASFRNGYGTILFFEDQSIVENLQKQFPLYKDNFPLWSLQSSGMLQFIVWTALELEGLGASLQHYNPLIDAQVRQEWRIPGPWKLMAEMPFGKTTAPAGEKGFMPLEERVLVFK